MSLFDGLISFRTFRMVLSIVIVGCNAQNLSANWPVLRSGGEEYIFGSYVEADSKYVFLEFEVFGIMDYVSLIGSRKYSSMSIRTFICVWLHVSVCIQP